jgi:selenide,water dikinase
VLRQLPPVTHPNLLVGSDTTDDAAVYKMNDDVALIQTVDFFPPVVDDAFSYGAIAAANAFSDVYAMGGKPLLALNIVGFPVELPKEILGRVLLGGAAKAQEAGVLIVGGHTIDDAEPKYGMAVTGTVEPGKQITNAGARAGDVLVLTKPIGTGIITTAGKQERVTEDVLSNTVEIMSTLNRAASEAMVEVGVNACVDVTGFGLIGHLLGMLNASKVSAEVAFGAVPLLNGVGQLVAGGLAPGGTKRNLHSSEGLVEWADKIGDNEKLLLCDAQTSGGLLIAVSEERLDALLAALERHGVLTIAVVGRITEDMHRKVRVTA